MTNDMSERELHAEWRRLQEAVELETDDDRALDLWRELDAVTDRVLALDKAELQELVRRDDQPPQESEADISRPEKSFEELSVERRELERLIEAEADPDKQYALMLELYDLSARTLAASRRETAIVEAEHREWREKKRRED